MQVVFATNNAHKVTEVRAILAGSGFKVLTLAEAGLDIDPEENGTTFEANAAIKARAVHALCGGWVVADDSGIEVDALGGAPGVQSKRYSEQGTAQANNAKLLRELKGRSDRTARFRCVLAVVDPDGNEAFADGRCEGTIAHELSGAQGFGYDPLFLPDDHPGRSMAELTMEEKNAISHRGRAFRELPRLLKGVR